MGQRLIRQKINKNIMDKSFRQINKQQTNEEKNEKKIGKLTSSFEVFKIDPER